MFFIMVVCTYTEDWKSDQYRWYQNGTKKLPGGGAVVKKVHYICVTPHGKDKSFKRLAYSLLDNTNNLTWSITWVITALQFSFHMETQSSQKCTTEHAHLCC